MSNEKKVYKNSENKKEKGLLRKIIEKIDKKIYEKAKKSSCCKGKGCC
ncbi:MAG: hypothetical protein Fur0012_10280 [Elusimicrobiota bacterium]